MNDGIELSRSPVREVIEAASRRRTLVLLLDRGGLAVVVMLSGVALFLLLGAQILNWPWLLLLAVAGGVLTWWRVRTRMASGYRVAQLVDRRLALSDALSTAWFLLDAPAGRERPMAQAQIESAESVARSVDPAKVFPLAWRPVWTVSVLLAGLVATLFSVRYLQTSSLSFQKSMIRLPAFSPIEVLEHLEEKIAGRSPQPKQLALGGVPDLQGSQEAKKSENARQEKREATERRPTPSPDSSKAMGDSKGPLDGAKRDAQASGRDAQGQAQSGNRDGSAEEESKNESGRRDGQSPDKQPPGAPNRDGQNSLANRMKDALSGLMDKMRPASSAQKSEARERSEQRQQAQGQTSSNNSRSAETGQKANNSKDKEGEGREQSAQAQAQAQASEKSSAAQSSASSEEAKRQGAAQSGIGRQDGDKGLREAEQLRAMGKLDEIIGKRAASLTGEMTVETQSSHQELRTQYSGRVGHHADLGGEIDRDEVPPALQKYVREYMDQVHKQADSKQ